MPVPGPSQLGRGVVVGLADPVPPAWDGAPEVVVDGPDAVAALHDAWHRRTSVVVRLAIDPTTFRVPPTTDEEPWTLGPEFLFPEDRLHFLVWANTYDAREGKEPIWWWARKAVKLGATDTPDGPADVRLPDGSDAWIDGGPRQSFELSTVHAETIDLGRLTLSRPPAEPAPEIVLAPDQMAAVSHTHGAARIVAPAGSGKTRVLTERLRYMLGIRGIETETVLAVAYNKKAQEELAGRSAAFRPRVVTLNALGWELLGRPPILEEREVRRLIESIVPKAQRRANVDPYAPYLEALAATRLGFVDPALVEDERDDVPGFAEAFPLYRNALQRKGVVDFDEQIYGAVERLLRDGPFRRAAQQRHRHLLVDEFQDLTPCHVLMLRLLASPELDVFGVGDDDQVIYGHAGASPAFLIEFEHLFPGAASHPLRVNYRCPVPVVDAARTLLGYNRRRVEKEIHAGPSASPDPAGFEVRRHRSEEGATEVVRIVRKWLDAGAQPSEIAVLTRVGSLLLAPQVALTSDKVAVSSTLEPRVLDRTGVRAALAYVRIATSPDGFAAADVIEVLRRPSRGLPQWIDKWFRNPSMNVRDVRAIANRMDDEKVSGKVLLLADDLGTVVNAGRKSTTRQLLRVIKDQIGLGQAMSMLDASAASSHLDDLEGLEQVADLHPDPAGFEPWLRSVLATPPAANGVTLSTVHRVKGREWPYVVLFGVNDGIIPHRLSTDREEERRVLHVGITRGHRHVVVLADDAKASPFLGELDGSAPPDPVRALRTPRERTVDRAAEKKAVLRTAAKTSLADAEADVDASLLEALRVWRRDRAKRDGVPPYVILHDKHLVGLAAAKPTTMAALSRLDGIGPRRLELYGEEILAVMT